MDQASSPAPRGNYFAALPVRVPGGWLEALRDGAPQALRWFHPDDLHLTLAFFGREREDRVPPVLDLLRKIPYSGSTANAGRLLALPSRRRFSALSFELLDGRDTVATLIGNWRNRLLVAAGCPADTRPPLPHLTIARPARRHPAFSKRTILDWLAGVGPPAAEIEILPAALFGWSDERPRRQFRLIGNHQNG
jgi:2'-5' RNA ligase